MSVGDLNHKCLIKKQMNQREKLTKEMTRTAITQRELAEQLKIRPSTISDYLRGLTPWNADKYEQAINYLKSKQNVLQRKRLQHPTR